MEDLQGRARRVAVRGHDLPSLDPADGLLHLLLHTSASGSNRLVWLKDVERLLATCPPDWDVVADRAADTGLGLVAATVLAKARVTVRAPVPAAILDRLDGNAVWRGVAALARHRPARVHRRRGPPRLTRE